MDEQKIKIVHIMQSAGGVAEYVKSLLKNINKDKYQNIIIVSNDYKKRNDVLKYSSKHYFVDMIREINIKKDFLAIKQIRKILKKEQPDIVYLHSSKAGALGRLALFFNKKIKIIYNAHGFYFNADIGKKKKVYELIEKVLAFKTDKIIAISKSEYSSALEKKICNEKKLVLIENGIEINRFENAIKYRDEIRNKYNIAKETTVVGIVGRLSLQKDPITSIKAANKIIKKDRSIYFMFIGSGELENEIMSYAKENNIDTNIIITGWIDNVEKYISAIDIALLPSKWEGFGLAIAEYMACKKPIITTKIGGIANILDSEEKAFFIEKGDYNKIVEYIEYIIKNKEKVQKIVEKNYKECKDRFEITREVKDTENVFRKLTN